MKKLIILLTLVAVSFSADKWQHITGKWEEKTMINVKKSNFFPLLLLFISFLKLYKINNIFPLHLMFKTKVKQ